jgi:hypothetical protein
LLYTLQTTKKQLLGAQADGGSNMYLHERVKGMKNAKYYTQRITWILVFLLAGLLIVTIAQLMKVTSLISAIDNMFPEKLFWFWGLLFVTRLAYGSIVLFLTCYCVDKLEKLGYFWFKYEEVSRRSEPESIDQSGKIVGGFVLAGMLIVISEMLIRISTMSLPPYGQWYYH